MSFFDEAPALPEHGEPEPRRRRWRGDSDDTLGMPVPYADFLIRTDDLAIVVTGLVAFPAGFCVSIVSLSRLDPPREPMNLVEHGLARGARAAAEAFRFGIGFSDGTKVFNGMHGRRPDTDRGARVLSPRGGGGGGRRFAHGFWCAPLPPAGMMRFVCRWPARGVEEASTEVEAQLILDAAARAVTIWPDDAYLPEEEGLRGRPSGFTTSGAGYGVAEMREVAEPEQA
jgi:hypothetical protein